LDLKTLEYHPAQKVKFPVLELTKSIDDLKERFKVLLADKDRAGDFYRSTFYAAFQYASNRIPEIADELFRIDDAIEAGFGWEMGPFKIWDALDVTDTVKAMETMGNKPAQWVYDMLESNHSSFYKIEDGKKYYYDIASKDYKVIPGTENLVLLENIRSEHTIWKN